MLELRKVTVSRRLTLRKGNCDPDDSCGPDAGWPCTPDDCIPAGNCNPDDWECVPEGTEGD